MSSIQKHIRTINVLLVFKKEKSEKANTEIQTQKQENQQKLNCKKETEKSEPVKAARNFPKLHKTGIGLMGRPS
jgi:hypothetical protein